jgi:hypothetical protein
MITSLILSQFLILIYAVTWPIFILPNVTINPDLASSFQTFGSYLQSLNNVLPISTFLAIFALIIVIEIAVVIWGVINWGLRRIPTQS